MTKLIMTLSVMMFFSSAFASSPILADAKLLKKLQIPIISTQADLNIGFARVSEADKERISRTAHETGKCGGYQELEQVNEQTVFEDFKVSLAREKKYLNFKKSLVKNFRFSQFDPKIRDAVREVSDSEIGNWVSWLAGFGGRFHASSNPNKHTVALADKLRQMVSGLAYPATVTLVQHRRTQQSSVRLHLEGSTRPHEIVVLGGHLDSINWSYFGDKNQAPGADDNASGSGALLEALRVLLKQGQPERSIELMFYAAEEVGLYGSTEISGEYKAAGKDVVAVLQLDMTMHPGSGENVISSETDFTSAWLRDLLLEWNKNYLNVKIIADECGYACSDHAPWYKNGYSTLMPFESHTDKMNSKIHTPNDTLNSSSSLKHAAIFSKIAVIFAMDLANSNMRQP
ncbi:MAG: M20/M25/M40 family metallo-hydrolase [Bdellovibrionales bacterium]|nr:M20/M25/M40 family metallo-hydrolase [Bdellovibrionales bacterium]